MSVSRRGRQIFAAQRERQEIRREIWLQRASTPVGERYLRKHPPIPCP